jgi:hypothetical protein
MVLNSGVCTIFGIERKEVARGWRKLRSEKLHDFFFSSNVITVVRSRGMRWTERVVHAGEKR